MLVTDTLRGLARRYLPAVRSGDGPPDGLDDFSEARALDSLAAQVRRGRAPDDPSVSDDIEELKDLVRRAGTAGCKVRAAQP